MAEQQWNNRGRSNNYQLSNPHRIVAERKYSAYGTPIASGDDDKVLPQGAFVRPLYIGNVPKDTIAKWPKFDPIAEVFCYTRYGIVPIPKYVIVECH